MDFLDPNKRRHYHIRLITGYILVAIVIALGTVIVVYGANGYGINRKTGQIVQNGLVFTDSHPSNAEIYLNGVDQNSSTSSRLVLPAGNYELTLKKDGYRDWSRKFSLNEQSVSRYAYPFLFPTTPTTSTVKNYDSLPGLVTQSPDYKWLLVENTLGSVARPVFDVYDTTTLDKTAVDTTTLELPVNLLTNFSLDSKLTEVEWSTDNNHLLVEHDYPGGSEFVVINRSRPDESFNVDQMFNSLPVLVNMRDRKIDQLYLLSAAGDLQVGDSTTKTVSTPILKQVLAYKPYSTSLITYITDVNEPAGMVAGKIWSGGKTYKLNEFTAGKTYLIEAAQFQGNFYYVVGSDTSGRLNIYKDPLDGLKDPAVKKALPFIALQNPGTTKLKFSDNTRFIGTEIGQTFAIYDLETLARYKYSLTNPLAGTMDWMDGHRLIGVSGGNVLVMDYDGVNKQTISPSLLPQGAIFSGNYNHMITLTAAESGTGFVLKDVDLRAGADLPKK